jgi:hypothetical protein
MRKFLGLKQALTALKPVDVAYFPSVSTESLFIIVDEYH